MEFLPTRPESPARRETARHRRLVPLHFDDERVGSGRRRSRPCTATPPAPSPLTTELVLSHSIPTTTGTSYTLDAVRRHHQAFSTRHRIIDTAGRIRHVPVVADTAADDTGEVVERSGLRRRFPARTTSASR